MLKFLAFLAFQLLISTGYARTLLNVSVVPHPKALGAGPHSYDYMLGLSSNIDTPADIVFVDYDIDAEVIGELLDQDKTVICYVNVGAWEDWRSDADDFPSSVIGNDYDGWPGENWLDIRDLDTLLPIMSSRFEVAADKGCQGIDPDNVNGYTVDSGFDLTADDQIEFNKAIAEEIRSMGLLAGLKNDNEQAIELVNSFDFAVLESCAVYEECEPFYTFIEEDKPVFAIEYTDEWDEADFINSVCPLMEETGISFILKNLDLNDDYIVTCDLKKTQSKTGKKNLHKKSSHKQHSHRRAKPIRGKQHRLSNSVHTK